MPIVIADTTYYKCYYNIDMSEIKKRIFMVANFIFTFFVPMLVLLCSYSAIMRKLREDSCTCVPNTATSKPAGQNGKEKNILRKSTPINHRSKVVLKLIKNQIKISNFLINFPPDHQNALYSYIFVLRMLGTNKDFSVSP